MAMADHDYDVVIEQILVALKAEQQGDSRYRGLCPAHDDHSPSLDIYVNSGGYIGFNCLSKRCKQFEIVKAIKTKFNLDVPQRRSSPSDDKVQSAKVLYPAHEPSLPFRLFKDGQTLYEYHTELGEVAFIVQRYMDGDKKQTPAWFSVEYVSDGGKVDRQWSSKDPPKKDRPLYHLDQLSANAVQKVLVVEGEKTADAASNMPQLADFIVTTWSGGSKNVRATNWLPLRDRMSEIYFWPDHDSEGIKAMKEIAALVTTGPDDQRLHMLHYEELVSSNTRISKGWDLADGCGNLECDFSFEDLFETFRPYYSEKSVSAETLEEALQLRDQRFRKLLIGGATFIVDLTKPLEDSPFGLVWFRDVNSFAGYDVERSTLEIGDRVKQISIAREWYDTRGEGPCLLHGTTFDPTTTDRELTSHGVRKLNTFNGLPVLKVKNKSNKLVDIWLKHIEGMINETQAREWIIDYFADIFQNPGRKPGTALALLGGQGVGKSVLINAVSNILGPMSRLISKDITKNNVVLSRSLLVVHDEWSINSYREKPYYEALKNAITNNKIRIEEKYLPPWEADSFCRFAFTSNDSKPVRLPPDDRRFTIVHCDRTWHGNQEHFKSLFELSRDDGALLGLRDYFITKAIKSNLATSYNTVQKEELWETDSRVLNEIIQWADGNGLPSYFHELLPTKAKDFGDQPVIIPRGLMREFFHKSGIDKHYGKSEAIMLKRIMPGPEFKRRVEINDRNNTRQVFDLCFEIPSLEKFRRNIEKEIKRPYPWNDLEIKVDPADLEPKVVPLRKSPL